MNGEIKNILVLKIGGIGDLVLITPALRSLKEKYPDASLHLLASSHAVKILEGLPYVDEFVVCDDLLEAEGLMDIAKGIAGMFRLKRILAGKSFDVFIEFQNILSWGGMIKPLTIGALSGSKRRLGFDTGGKGFFLTDKVPDSRVERKHIVERSLEVVGLLDCGKGDKWPEVPLSSKDFGYAKNLLHEKGIDGTDFVIGVHAGANPKYIRQRSWLQDRFARVIDRLTEKYGAKVILFGGSHESDWIHGVYDKTESKPLDLSGQNTIKQTAALVKRCNFFLANDSGLMHIAAALKVPTVGIFGCGDYKLYGTYPPEFNFTAIYKERKPDYPRAVRKGYDRYMQLVTVKEVLEACEKKIDLLLKK